MSVTSEGKKGVYWVQLNGGPVRSLFLALKVDGMSQLTQVNSSQVLNQVIFSELFTTTVLVLRMAHRIWT